MRKKSPEKNPEKNCTQNPSENRKKSTSRCKAQIRLLGGVLLNLVQKSAWNSTIQVRSRPLENITFPRLHKIQDPMTPIHKSNIRISFSAKKAAHCNQNQLERTLLSHVSGIATRPDSLQVSDACTDMWIHPKAHIWMSGHPDEFTWVRI